MAVTLMGLAPRDFWRLTLTEWRWLVAAFAPAENEIQRREDLAALINQYPDEKS